MRSSLRTILLGAGLLALSVQPVFAVCTQDRARPVESGGMIAPRSCSAVDVPRGAASFDVRVDEADAARLWTFNAAAAPGGHLPINVVGPDGNVLALSQRTMPDGLNALADLELAPGDYKVRIDNRSESPFLFEMEDSGARQGAASEPDGARETANPIALDDPATGRFYGVSAASDSDYFALTLDEPAFVDAVLEGPERGNTWLQLLGDGGARQEIKGQGTVALYDLWLEPGTHWFRASGALGADQRYTLTLTDKGAPGPGQEFEPNDRLDHAAPMGETLRGRLTEGNRTDYLVFETEGEPQLWRIQAVGDHFNHLYQYDNGGIELARADRETGKRFVRLSNLLLPPGRHVFSINGDPGSYIVRMLPLGPPPRRRRMSARPAKTCCRRSRPTAKTFP